MLAQAMSKTMPVIEKSSVSGVRAPLMVELWPLRPSASVTFFALNWVIVRALMLL